MRKFFRKHRKLLVTMAIMAITAISMCLITSASDATGSGFGTVLEEFIQILVGGLEGLGSGIGTGSNNFVQNLFLTVDGSGNVTGLSMFGGVSAIFGGIALAIGLTTLIFNWIRSLGN